MHPYKKEAVFENLSFNNFAPRTLRDKLYASNGMTLGVVWIRRVSPGAHQWISSISSDGINFEARSSLRQSRDTEIALRQAYRLCKMHGFANTFQRSKLLTRLCRICQLLLCASWKLRARAWNMGSPCSDSSRIDADHRLYFITFHDYSGAWMRIDKTRRTTGKCVITYVNGKYLISHLLLYYYKLKDVFFFNEILIVKFSCEGISTL